MAGLSAAWRLNKYGVSSIRVLEAETIMGGNAAFVSGLFLHSFTLYYALCSIIILLSSHFVCLIFLQEYCPVTI